MRGRVRTSFSTSVTSRTPAGGPCRRSGAATLKLPPGPLPPEPNPGVGGTGLGNSCCARVPLIDDLLSGIAANEITSEYWSKSEITSFSTIVDSVSLKTDLVRQPMAAQPQMNQSKWIEYCDPGRWEVFRFARIGPREKKRVNPMLHSGDNGPHSTLMTAQESTRNEPSKMSLQVEKVAVLHRQHQSDEPDTFGKQNVNAFESRGSLR